MRFSRLWAVLALVLLFVISCSVVWALIEPRTMQLVEYTYSDPDLPKAFDGMTVALITDIHRGPFVSPKRVAQIVDRVNGLQPDAVVLGGDYVYRSESYIQPVFDELSRLRAPLGVYGVLGNHDHYEGGARTRRMMERSGVVDIDDRGVWLERGRSRIRLGGVDDLEEGFPDLDPVLAGTQSRDFVLLAAHNPDFVGHLPVGAVDLMLSGHTHGGQVTFFGLWAPAPHSRYGQEYLTGLVENGRTPVVVSNGLGTIVLPIRFLAAPQIVLIHLRAEGQG